MTNDYIDYEDILQSTKKKGRPKGSPNKNKEYKEKMRKRENAKKELWSKGILNWKLDSNQMDLYRAYRNNVQAVDLTWMTSRQIGKSTTVCVIIAEELYQNEGWKIAYIAPTISLAREVVHQTFMEIFADCPDSLRPKFNSQTNKWTFPNGSELKLAGTDNRNADNIRGNRFQRVFIDEFAFLSDFNYVIRSCVGPTLTSVVGGFTVYISSPPATPDHESNELIDQAEEDGTIIVKDIYTCPRFDAAHIEKIIKRYGGVDSIDFRREYLVERITDTSKLVIPEASEEKIREITLDVQLPEFYNIIESFDWGVMDNTAGLFGFIDYHKQVLVILNEMFLDGIHNTTEDIARFIIQVENDTWGYSSNKIPRYCDNNLQIINDMTLSYNLNMIGTKKDNLQAHINNVRNLLRNNQIIIHPRCVNLLEQIKSCQWKNNSKKEFSRRNGHHYDLVATLIYMVRNANMSLNPFPEHYGIPKNGNWHIPKLKQNNTEFLNHLHNCFVVKRKK